MVIAHIVNQVTASEIEEAKIQNSMYPVETKNVLRMLAYN